MMIWFLHQYISMTLHCKRNGEKVRLENNTDVLCGQACSGARSDIAELQLLALVVWDMQT